MGVIYFSHCFNIDISKSSFLIKKKKEKNRNLVKHNTLVTIIIQNLKRKKKCLLIYR